MDKPTQSTGPTLIKDDKGLTYTVVAKSADKYIGQCNQDPTKAIAVARTAAKNKIIQDEFGILQWIEDDTSAVPVFGDVFMVSNPENSSEQCAAFRMQWIDGIHSKTNKPDFERALAAQKDNPTTQEDLKRISNYITQKAGIEDLQVMIENTTGHLKIVDPRGLKNAPSPEHAFIKIWNDLLSGKRLPTTAESYDKKD